MTTWLLKISGLLGPGPGAENFDHFEFNALCKACEACDVILVPALHSVGSSCWNMSLIKILIIALLPSCSFASSPGTASFSKRLTAGQEAIAGATAGFAARIAVAPIDLVKIRLQLQRNHIGEFSNGVSSSRPNIPECGKR